MDPTTDHLKKRLEDIADELAEHADGVLILLTLYEDGQTKFRTEGRGNHLLREGMAREYVKGAEREWRDEEDSIA